MSTKNYLYSVPLNEGRKNINVNITKTPDTETSAVYNLERENI